MRTKGNTVARVGTGRGRDVSGQRGYLIRADIERRILSGEALPGAKLDEEAIAQRHGASRTPVREALQHLASQGLVDLRPNAGAFVSKLTVAEVAEMFETMAFLEAACAAMAARRHTALDRRQLKVTYDECARAERRGNPGAFYAANARFHECIYAASHNGHLAHQTIVLRNRLEAYRREATFHPGLMAATMREHKRILQAILKMDEAAATTEMRSHLDTLRDDAVSMTKVLARTITKKTG